MVLDFEKPSIKLSESTIPPSLEKLKNPMDYRDTSSSDSSSSKDSDDSDSSSGYSYDNQWKTRTRHHTNRLTEATKKPRRNPKEIPENAIQKARKESCIKLILSRIDEVKVGLCE
jgi:hypothetical protein